MVRDADGARRDQAARHRRRPTLHVVSTLVLVHMLLQPSRASAVMPPVPAAQVPRSVWLYEADAGATAPVRHRLHTVLDQVRPANRRLLLDAEVRIHVIPQDRRLTDLPMWAHLQGTPLPDPNPHDRYAETRTYDDLRGLGPARCTTRALDIAIAEEHVVAIAGGSRPSPPGSDVGRLLVHEVGHAVECGLTAEQDVALDRAHVAVQNRPPRDVVGDIPSYTASTPREYFAEGVVAWFEAGRGPTYRRAWLREHDPALYDLLAEVFGNPG